MEFIAPINISNLLHQYTVTQNKYQKMVNAVLNHTTKFHYVNRNSYDIKCKVYTDSLLVRATPLSLITVFTFSHSRGVTAQRNALFKCIEFDVFLLFSL
jgi:hypothetical protein